MLSGMVTLSGEIILSRLLCLPSEKGFSLKGNNLLPLGANYFLLEETPYQRGFGHRESKQDVTAVVSFVNMLH